MTNNHNDNISNIKFSSVNINDHVCNINRTLNEDIYLLNHFDNATPKYDLKNGPHLEIYPKKLNESPSIVPLNNSVCNGMLIENSPCMEDEEYYIAFVEKKKLLLISG